MSWADWLERLRRTLDLSEGLEIFFLVGPPELARPTLERVAEATRSLGIEHWHRLHIDGIDGLFESQQVERSVRLIHGLERMRQPEAARMSAALNVNRDALALTRDAYVLWIPADLLDEFMRSAPDLIAWRSEIIEVEPSELELDPEREIIELLLLRTWTSAASHAPPRDVELSSGEVLALVDWIAEPRRDLLAVGQPNEAGLDARLASMATARILAARAETLPNRPVPLDLDDYRTSERLWWRSKPLFDKATFELRLPHRLHDALRRLWATDRLQLFCAASDEPLPPRRLMYRWGDEAPRLAPLSDAQLRFMATTLLVDAGQDIGDWTPVVDGLIEATRNHPSQRSTWFIDGVIEDILAGPAPLDDALEDADDPQAWSSYLTGLEAFFRFDWNRTPDRPLSGDEH